ncbi:sodium transporter HKT1-like [Rutidosis leptorrhynchoides]|uniref:sodium transporter HKT1-like n=1 Tax=Rutidosis leptorrhynchoides TaxID=125765 RepID=UPI003A990B04
MCMVETANPTNPKDDWSVSRDNLSYQIISHKKVFTHDLWKKDEIEVKQIRSSDNLTDLFTKSLPIATFEKEFQLSSSSSSSESLWLFTSSSGYLGLIKPHLNFFCFINPMFPFPVSYFSFMDQQPLNTSNCCCSVSNYNKACSFYNSLKNYAFSVIRFFVVKVNPICIHFVYFLVLSLFGYLALRFTKPRKHTPKHLDMFFTSVSAVTVSSMSSVEMEVFSDTQFVILSILMFTGGEVFTSLLELRFSIVKSNFSKPKSMQNIGNINHPPNRSFSAFQIESDLEIEASTSVDNIDRDNLRSKSIKILSYIVLSYLIGFHVIGYIAVSTYISLVSTAKRVLKSKNISIQIFSVFIVVSCFTNCGYEPTNENMLVFKKDSGFLLLLIPQILLGNTLYAPMLRFIIWLLSKFTKKLELNFVMQNYGDLGYSHHLFSGRHCKFLAITVMGFTLLQFVAFCCLEWNSETLCCLSLYEKIVASLFQVANSRHAGLSIFDLSAISPAMLVIFVAMMYLPQYTAYIPTRYQEIKAAETDEKSKRKRKRIMENLKLSQVTYLVIFVILVCITERRKLKEDPLNFNVLNITIEVTSAYGNVGLSTGYSCERRIKPDRDSSCVDTFVGLSGKLSIEGKWLIILIMFFGRLKRYSRNGGKAWILY